MLDLYTLGWSPSLQEHLSSLNDPGLRPARVSILDRGRFQVLGMEEPAWAVLPGSHHHTVSSALDAPAVGDWVAVRPGEHPTIAHVLPRRSRFVRRSGSSGAPQVVATNLDRVFIVTAIGADLNPRRLERYLATVLEGGAEPVIVVNKTDLTFDWGEVTRTLRIAAPGIPTAFVSATADGGMGELAPYLTPGATVALVGSSGVGKSSLTNRILGREIQDTGGIRLHDERGKHTTTRRELFITEGGVILIDTPGLRTVLLWRAEEGVAEAFHDVSSLAGACRFRDCTHQGEPGCAVRDAVDRGDLDERRVAGYQKLQRELEYADRRGDARLEAAARQKWKTIHKSQKQRDRLLRGVGER